jgi:hypothetical protein
MKNRIYFLFTAAFISLLASSCIKEKLESDNLSGEWTYSTVRYSYLRNDTVLIDSTFTESGWMNITNNSPINGSYGGTTYGDFASGRARLPFELAQGFVYVTQGEIAFSMSSQRKPKASFRNKYEGIMMYWRDNVSQYNTFSTSITLINHNTLQMRIRTHVTPYEDDVSNEQKFDIELKRK